MNLIHTQLRVLAKRRWRHPGWLVAWGAAGGLARVEWGFTT